MANQKISQLTAVSPAVDADEFVVNQGGVNKKATLLQILAHVEAGINIANLTYAPVSGTYAATDVDGALDEIWNNNAAMVDGIPILPAYMVNNLPNPATYQYGFVLVTDDVDGVTPVYSDGAVWRTVADRTIAVEAIPSGDMVLTGDAPVVLTPIIREVPAEVLTLFSVAPTVEVENSVAVPPDDLIMTTTPPISVVA